MTEAVALVQKGELSFRAASKRFNIPHMTIFSRLKGDGHKDRSSRRLSHQENVDKITAQPNVQRDHWS